MAAANLPAEIIQVNRLLTAAEFHRLADVPPEVEWFANLSNPHTRRAYENAIARLHAVHRHRPAGGIPHRDARAHHRLARRPGAARAWRQHDPAPARGAGLAVRISLREKRRHPQPGQRRGAAEDRKAAKARRRRSAIIRRASCWRRRRRTPSRASATAPFCRRCCSTRCGARNCASSRSRISGTPAKACRI